MFTTYFYNMDVSYHFDTLQEAIEYGLTAAFEFIVMETKTKNIVFG
jgi:hypothetical protein